MTRRPAISLNWVPGEGTSRPSPSPRRPRAGVPTTPDHRPELTGQLHGLQVLATNVEDEHHNCTRFLVLAREPRTPPLADGPMITSFVFRVRTSPSRPLQAMGDSPPTVST